MLNRRRQIILGLILLAATAALVYGERAIYTLKILNATRVGQQFRQTYAHATRDVVFNPAMTPRLDVYSPASGDKHPVLIFVHGGGWKDFDKTLFASVAQKMLPENLVVVIPDYTLYPDGDYRLMAREVAAVIAWTLDHIASYGGDPQRVVVAGHSAGAHLITLATLDPSYLAEFGHRSDDLCGLVGMSGVYDINAQFAFEQANGREAPVMTTVMGGRENFAATSPISYVRPNAPPILLIHGDQDETVPVSISQNFQAALQAAGARSNLIIYPGAGHSDFLFAALTEPSPRIVTDLARFTEQCGQQANPIGQ